MIDIILAYLDEFVTFMNNGGIVMWVLFGLNLMLWYGLGYRYIVLQRGTKGTIHRLIEKHEKRGKSKVFVGLLDYFIKEALEKAKELQGKNVKLRDHLDDIMFSYLRETSKYSVLVKTIVMLAPLVGLLGTVMGMIETFDALQSSSMFSQGNSISGGISKALFTTELGLVVAVPGLLLGRILDRKEETFALEFEQIVNIICTKDNHAS